MVRIVFALALVGCSYDSTSPEGTDTVGAIDDTVATPPALEAAHCAGSDPGVVPGYEAYRLSEVTLPSGDVDAANWVWHAAAVVPVNVDVGSFQRAGIDRDTLLATLGDAMHFWNAGAAGFNLTMGEEVACCDENGGEDCAACDGSDGEVYLRMEPGADDHGIPAYTRSYYGDDPATEAPENACLVATQLRFFPAGVAPEGTPVTYTWVDTGDDVEDTDGRDGTLEKPFHDTLVHELGHALGLGDQDDPSVACSVMAHCADTACGCDYDTIGPIDTAALRHVYRQR